MKILFTVTARGRWNEKTHAHPLPEIFCWGWWFCSCGQQLSDQHGRNGHRTWRHGGHRSFQRCASFGASPKFLKAELQLARYQGAYYLVEKFENRLHQSTFAKWRNGRSHCERCVFEFPRLQHVILHPNGMHLNVSVWNCNSNLVHKKSMHELALKRYDVVEVTGDHTGEMLYGQLVPQQGYFPKHCVKEVEENVPPLPPRPIY